ncbi:MAG: hypothetical protein M3041_10340 [Acidobacteriota bacterium]|nr:hypothetical protein [Acidobacteriota bacterium]
MISTSWEEYLLFGAFFAAVAGVYVLWAVLQSRGETKRRKALASVAAAAGWDSPQYSEVQAKFEKLRGKETWTSNPIVRRDGSCVLFDYMFVRKPMGSTRWSYDVLQTVVYVRSDRLDLPVMSIEPLRFSAPSDKTTFADAYTVRSAERAIFDEFPNAETREYLLTNTGISINGEGNEIFVFRPGNLATPDQILEFAKWGEGVARMFERPA